MRTRRGFADPSALPVFLPAGAAPSAPWPSATYALKSFRCASYTSRTITVLTRRRRDAHLARFAFTRAVLFTTGSVTAGLRLASHETPRLQYYQALPSRQPL